MFLLFDIGGTNMRIAVSEGGKEIDASKSVLTPQDFVEGMRICEKIAKELVGEEHIEAIAGGIAGTLDKEHMVLLRSPHMPGWVEKPLKKELGEMFGVPVYLENDAALAGLGEASMGAARGYDIAAYITVSTGVGGVRIVDGAIDRNAMGFEIGHQVINYDDKARTLEECVSGSGFLRRFGKLPQDIADQAVWEEAARLLAVGLHNTILHWSPEVLVLGGPLILQSPFPFDVFSKHFNESVYSVLACVPEIKKVELGEKSGLYGALAFLYLKHGT